MGIGAAIGGIAGSLIGASGQKSAAKKASSAQVQAGREAIAAQERAQAQLRGDLDPFRQFGTELVPQAQALFGPTAAQSILQDPALQALQQDAERRILAGQAARGRVGAGETPEQLQDAFLRTGVGFLSQQRGDLLSALGLGQSAAVQVGSAGTNTAGNVGNLLSQIGNVRAAGTIGAQNAQTAGLQNLIGIGSAFIPQQQPLQQTFDSQGPISFGPTGFTGTGVL